MATETPRVPQFDAIRDDPGNPAHVGTSDSVVFKVNGKPSIVLVLSRSCRYSEALAAVQEAAGRHLPCATLYGVILDLKG